MTVSLLFIVQFMATNTAMQGAYIPQYPHLQTTVPVEVCFNINDFLCV